MIFLKGPLKILFSNVLKHDIYLLELPDQALALCRSHISHRCSCGRSLNRTLERAPASSWPGSQPVATLSEVTELSAGEGQHPQAKSPG